MDRRRIKRLVSSICFGMFLNMTFSLIYLWYYFTNNRPAHREPQLGFIYPFSIKSGVVYVTGAESNQATLPWIVCGVSMIFLALLQPKRIRFPKSREERWLWQQMGVSEFDDPQLINSPNSAFLLSVGLSLIATFLFGKLSANLLPSISVFSFCEKLAASQMAPKPND